MCTTDESNSFLERSMVEFSVCPASGASPGQKQLPRCRENWLKNSFTLLGDFRGALTVCIFFHVRTTAAAADTRRRTRTPRITTNNAAQGQHWWCYRVMHRWLDKDAQSLMQFFIGIKYYLLPCIIVIFGFRFGSAADTSNAHPPTSCIERRMFHTWMNIAPKPCLETSYIHTIRSRFTGARHRLN